MGPQTGGRFGWRDMTALPCSHPHCCSIGYAIRTDAGDWKSLVGMIGHEELKANLDLVSNHIADKELPARLRRLLKDSLLGLLSDQASLTHPSVPQLLRNVCDHCDLGVGTLARIATRPGAEGRRRIRELLAHRVKRIVVKPFMDLDTMLEERLQQCCVHVGSQLARTATSPEHEGRRRIGELLAHRVKRIVVKPFMDLDTMIEERLQQCCVHVGSRPKTVATSAPPSAPCRRGRSWGAPACRPGPPPPTSRRSRSDGRRRAPAPAPPARDRSPHPRAPSPAASARCRDPLHWCVFATVSLLTWALGPAVLLLFSGAGLIAYGRAWSRGRRSSRCLLRDTRLVLLYLGLIAVVAATATVRGW